MIIDIYYGMVNMNHLSFRIFKQYLFQYKLIYVLLYFHN